MCDRVTPLRVLMAVKAATASLRLPLGSPEKRSRVAPIPFGAFILD